MPSRLPRTPLAWALTLMLGACSSQLGTATGSVDAGYAIALAAGVDTGTAPSGGAAPAGWAAPLEQVSRSFGVPAVPPLVAIGAVTAVSLTPPG